MSDERPKVEEIEEEDLEVIVLRNISREEAKKEVQELLKKTPKPLDHGEIADELKLDLKLTSQVIKELINEGIIKFT